MDHADAVLDGDARRGDADLLAPDEDLALRRLIEPYEDIHQGGLARTVLAEKRVDLALLDIEGDVAVRIERTEALADVLHPQQFGHVCRLSLLGQLWVNLNIDAEYCSFLLTLLYHLLAMLS